MEPTSDTQLETDLTAEVDLSTPPTPTDLHDPRRRADVEQALRSVPGVLGARLVPGFDRQVDELHILTTLDKAPKQAVRDVQTVMMARFGVPTDHRVISVVQLDEGDGFMAATRAVIGSVAVTRSGHFVSAEVVLHDADRRHRGVGEASASASGHHRATAHATLAALQPMVGDSTAIEIEGVDVVEVLGHELAIALLQVHTDRNDLLLAGSAVVREATPEAVARAVLDALNRTVA